MKLNIEKALISFLRVLIIIFLFHKGILSAQEYRAGPIYQFGYLGIERPTGNIGFRFREDIFNSRNDDSGTETKTKYRLFNEELNLQTKMFIYDPRFMQLTLGGGIIFGQGDADYQGGDKLTKFNISAIFLKEHPYQGAFYFRKLEADFEHSPSSIYLLHNTEYGGSVILREGVFNIPIPLEMLFDSSHQQSDNIYKFLGRNDKTHDFYKFDETENNFSMESYKKWDNFDLFWKFSETDVTRINETADGINEIHYNQFVFDNRLSGKFGDDDRFRWKTKFDWRYQTDWPKYQYFDAGGELRCKIYDDISSALDSVFSMDAFKKDRYAEDDSSENQKNDSIKLRTGVEHRLYKSLFSELKLDYEKRFNTDFEETNKGILVGTKYVKEIPRGRIFTHYYPSYKEVERTGDKISFSNNEFHIASDYSSILLDSENIVIDSIVITDQSGNIIYQEGLDYRIYQIGRETYIERTAGSAIVNGDTVLVDYKFKSPRGSYREFNQNFSFGVRWWLFEPYIGIINKNQSLVEGDDLLLNPGNSLIYGLKLHPEFFKKQLTSEFKIEGEDNTYKLDPFHRWTTSGSISYNITKNVSVVPYFNKSLIDYENPGHDTDYFTAGANLNYESRLIRGFVGISDEMSIIGNSERNTKVLRNGVAYKFGDWTFDASLRAALETQENNLINETSRFYERDNMIIKFGVSRKF